MFIACQISKITGDHAIMQIIVNSFLQNILIISFSSYHGISLIRFII